MARFLDLLGELRSVAYGAPDPILEKSIRRAVQELCQRTQCWQERLDDIVLSDGTDRYELPAPFGATVERIVSLKLDGTKLDGQLRMDALHGMQTTTGRPRSWAHEPMTPFVIFWPTPGEDEDGLRVDILASLAPSEASQNIPDDMALKHGRGIVAWAKHDLMSGAPEMPWYNANEAGRQIGIAEELFSRAKRAQHSGHSKPLTVEPRRLI